MGLCPTLPAGNCNLRHVGGDQTRPAEFQPYTTTRAVHKYIAHAILSLTYRWTLRACTPWSADSLPGSIRQRGRATFFQGSPTRPCRLTNAIEIHHPVLHRGIDWGKGSGCFRVQCPMENQSRSPTLPSLWRSRATHSHPVPIGEPRLDTASGGAPRRSSPELTPLFLSPRGRCLKSSVRSLHVARGGICCSVCELRHPVRHNRCS